MNTNEAQSTQTKAPDAQLPVAMFKDGGIDWLVERRQTADEMQAQYPATADLMRKSGDAAQIVARRPKGNTLYCFYERHGYGTVIYQQICRLGKA